MKTNGKTRKLILTSGGVTLCAIMLFLLYALTLTNIIHAFPGYSNGIAAQIHVNTNPTLIAGGTEVAQGIREFSFPQPKQTGGFIRMALLFTLLMGFVLGPILVLYSVFQFKIAGNFTANALTDFFSFNRILLILGLALITEPVIFGAESLIEGMKHYYVLKDKAEEESERSYLTNELYHIAYDAGELSLIKKNGFGGEGSFNAGRDAAGRPVLLKLNVLPSYAKAQHGRYSIDPQSCDTLLIILGTGNSSGIIADYKNSDGSIGKIEHRLSITNQFQVRLEKKN